MFVAGPVVGHPRTGHLRALSPWTPARLERPVEPVGSAEPAANDVPGYEAQFQRSCGGQVTVVSVVYWSLAGQPLNLVQVSITVGKL